MPSVKAKPQPALPVCHMDRLIVSDIGLPSFARWRRTHAAA
jgi:hypothetical protein